MYIILSTNDIEPGQAEWASPFSFEHKKDKPLRFCVGYCIAVTAQYEIYTPYQRWMSALTLSKTHKFVNTGR